MTSKKCGCQEGKLDEACQSCKSDDIFAYWCKTCNRAVAEKRCPYCGLKTQRKKD